MSLTGFNLQRRRAAEKEAQSKRVTVKPTSRPEVADYGALTVPQLRSIAKDKGVDGQASMKRDDLIKALSEG